MKSILLIASLFLVGCASTKCPPPEASIKRIPLPAVSAPQPRIVSQGELVLACETLVASKNEIANGSVILRKVISTETVSVPVQLRTETYEVVRVGPNGQTPDFTPKEVRVDLSKEVASALVEARVTEVVSLRKVTGVQDSSVSGQVRCETVELVKQ